MTPSSIGRTRDLLHCTRCVTDTYEAWLAGRDQDDWWMEVERMCHGCPYRRRLCDRDGDRYSCRVACWQLLPRASQLGQSTAQCAIPGRDLITAFM